MKSLSMYRYTPLLLVISLFTFSGCAQINPRTAIEPEVIAVRKNTESYDQARQALSDLETEIVVISQDDNSGQYSEIKDKIEEVRALLVSSKTTINTFQAKKL